MDCEIRKIVKEYAIMTLTVPATPLPCALESAWQAHRGGSFINKRLVYNNVVTALRKHQTKALDASVSRCGRLPAYNATHYGSQMSGVVLLLCGIIVLIHYCEGGRQMASVKLLVKPESLCIPYGAHRKLTERRVSG